MVKTITDPGMTRMLKTLRSLFAVALFAPALAFAGQLPVHPMDFDGSEAQKTVVIDYITKNVYKQYCTGINMCQESMLRRMEQKDLDAFKLLTKAENRKVLDQAISDYCSNLDMCNYAMIQRMYEKNLAASKQKLSW
jgi:hypothetical protein